MTKITFLGGEATGNVGCVEWGRYRFELNKPVECKDDFIIGKAMSNPYFRVHDDDGEAAVVELAPRRGRPPKKDDAA